MTITITSEKLDRIEDQLKERTYKLMHALLREIWGEAASMEEFDKRDDQINHVISEYNRFSMVPTWRKLP